MKRISVLLLLIMFCCGWANAQQNIEKHRLIVLTDIENEPDDGESIVRLLLYSNVIDIEGIVATTSVHMKHMVAPESIEKAIDAYAKVRTNLLLHQDGWPTADYLRSITKAGLPKYGMTAVGKGCDSDGSELIISALKKDDPRPLWISVWGGVNTLAQALYKIKNECKPAEVAKLVAKLRVYTISDQDDSGIWIRKNFPSIFYIVSPGGYGNATWSGIMDADPNSQPEYIANSWIAQNIQQNHGPMGAIYPDVAYGVEGDTPSWLGLIPNGLNDMEHPDYGGWGGRYRFYTPKYESLDLQGFNGGVPIEPEPHDIWTNAVDSFYYYVPNEYGRAVRLSDNKTGGYKATVWRWRADFQRDFAARMDWTIMDYQSANHNPVAKLAHPEILDVKSGDWIVLDATGSSDPDGDNLSYLWFCYDEAGSFGKNNPIDGAENIRHVKVHVPQVYAPCTIHYILKVTDKGTPQLSSYKRVILNVKP
ncbi:MAG: DUF1593 domain-containing protein [Bacteroidales bacterium]|nr:DUF1593 domain-containing protein [Bacteroidales bacterium]